jgi:co-chaperonin GroES (HSP10)
MQKLRIFGERVAVKRVEEKLSGSILIPQNTVNLTRCIGQIVSVGDGVVRRDGQRKVMEMVVKEGDLVFFQMNSIQEVNSVFVVGEKEKKNELYTLNQGDCIARLTSEAITYKGFEMLGVWCLVEPFMDKPSANLVIPDIIDPVHSSTPRFRLKKLGTHANLVDVKEDQELIVEKMMVNPVEIEGKRYGFIDRDRIYGVVDAFGIAMLEKSKTK